MEWYLAVLLFAAANTVTPGLNNMMIMSSGLNFGIRRSIPHLLGILIGFPLMFVAVGVGFVSVILAVPELHLSIQVVGVLYLLYFAWLVATSADEVDNSKKKIIGFWQAVAIQWVNPKAWVMITGAFAAFTKTDADPFLQVLYITSAFVIVGVPTISAWLVDPTSATSFFIIAYRRHLSASATMVPVRRRSGCITRSRCWCSSLSEREQWEV